MMADLFVTKKRKKRFKVWFSCSETRDSPHSASRLGRVPRWANGVSGLNVCFRCVDQEVHRDLELAKRANNIFSTVFSISAPKDEHADLLSLLLGQIFALLIPRRCMQVERALTGCSELRYSGVRFCHGGTHSLVSLPRMQQPLLPCYGQGRSGICSYRRFAGCSVHEKLPPIE